MNITMNRINYINFGYDCSLATALKNVNKRMFSLPFDWIISNITSIELCFKDNFEKFHTGLIMNYDETRLMDVYGFQFPHDYPIENGKIIKNWQKHFSIVKEKYNRRIKRFKHILQDTKPIIALCRYNTSQVIKLKNILSYYFNKNNIYFINTSKEIYNDDKIINIDTEKNNIWNETDIWEKAIRDIENKIYNIN